MLLTWECIRALHPVSIFSVASCVAQAYQRSFFFFSLLLFFFFFFFFLFFLSLFGVYFSLRPEFVFFDFFGCATLPSRVLTQAHLPDDTQPDRNQTSLSILDLEEFFTWAFGM